MRQPEWQNKVARTSTKAIMKGTLALQKANERDENRSAMSNTGATSRKNADAAHAAINSKKMSPKKFKLVANSKLFNEEKPQHLCFKWNYINETLNSFLFSCRIEKIAEQHK